MATFDVKNDVTPKQTLKAPAGPTISQMRSALTTADGTTFTTAYLNGMSRNDMVRECVSRGLLTTGGLP